MTTPAMEEAARLLERTAAELETTAAHCRTAAQHMRAGEVPRCAAHALAARGHLTRASDTLDEFARHHADRARP